MAFHAVIQGYIITKLYDFRGDIYGVFVTVRLADSGGARPFRQTVN